jgi:hypothetical protein
MNNLNNVFVKYTLCENECGQNTHMILQQHGTIVYDKIRGDYNDEIPDATSQEWELAADHFLATEIMKIMNVVGLDYSL